MSPWYKKAAKKYIGLGEYSALGLIYSAPLTHLLPSLAVYESIRSFLQNPFMLLVISLVLIFGIPGMAYAELSLEDEENEN